MTNMATACECPSAMAEEPLVRQRIHTQYFNLLNTSSFQPRRAVFWQIEHEMPCPLCHTEKQTCVPVLSQNGIPHIRANLITLRPNARADYCPDILGAQSFHLRHSRSGPRENPKTGYRHFPDNNGRTTRERGELFADHYSQARQFYISQTKPEQTHIKNAFVFELSKVETPNIRSRVIAHLLNVDETLAKGVAEGLGLKDLPAPAPAARTPITDLAASTALSILKNGPESFAGRKLGVVITDGTDAALLDALQKAAKAEGTLIELVAPVVGGVTLTDGKTIPASQKIVGAPSVLYDAVVLLSSAKGTKLLSREATARDFVADAFAHAKFIAYGPDASPLLAKGGITPDEMDDGVIAIKSDADFEPFIATCRKLRFWDREAKTHSV